MTDDSIERSIDEVLDLDSGLLVPATTLLDRDEAEVFGLRHKLKKLEKSDKKWLVCSICKVPVYIAGRTDRQTFFFKHRHERGDCPIKTKGPLNQKQINAIKYQGARESNAHRHIKELIRQSLAADERFSDIKVEQVFHSLVETDRWRKPDVRASYKGSVTAFEIQLSTTFIDVIMERWGFYSREGAYLVWIFGRFDSEYQKFTEKDVLYNNNRNLFVVNETTAKRSADERCFIMECHYQQPRLEEGRIAFDWVQKEVKIDDLHFDRIANRLYVFDADTAFANAKLELTRPKRGEGKLEDPSTVRTEFEEFWLSRDDLAGDEFDNCYMTYWDRFRVLGLVEGSFYDRHNVVRDSVLSAMYSLKHARIVGFEFKGFIQIVHRVFDGYRAYIRQFWWLARAYNRVEWIMEQDSSGKLARKIEEVKIAMKDRDPEYARNSQSDLLLSFLFPVLAVRLHRGESDRDTA